MWSSVFETRGMVAFVNRMGSESSCPSGAERAVIRHAAEGGGNGEPVDQRICNVTRELQALGRMNMEALRAKYHEAFGQQTTSHNAAYLRKKIAWRIQEIAEGGVTERTLARLEELARTVPLRERPPSPAGACTPSGAAAKIAAAVRDPALPPIGTILRRVYQGTAHEVRVADNGFVYRGKTYKSLSTIAKAITGTTWNGRLFFGLTSRKRREAA